MSADSAVAIAWDLLKGAVTAIKRPIRYVMSSKSFADSLQEEVQNLQNEVQRVNVLVERARNNVRKFHGVFTMWEKKSGDALKEVGDLLGNFENATKTCCYGTLPDPKCRYQFSRKAEGKIKVIRELAQKFSGFKELDDISFSDPTPGNVPATNSANRECKDVVQSTTATASASSASTSNELSEDGVFESRTAIIRDIMGALADNSNSVVGVYGMGGVGKSTLLDDVVSRIREEKRFDLVAKADVSQNPDIKRIQSVIAHALGLDMKDYEYESMRADRLRERLGRLGTEEKKVLIILDNLWKGLDLKSVGIPCGHDNKAMGCKLLLTSRDQKVLRREMGCDKDFFLDKLEKKEAKILFERMVGDKVHKDEFRPLVNEALRKCEGLPLLIVTMAKHFKDAPSSDWRDDLNQIELSTNEGISGVINKMLQLSYDHLECNEAKRLLQLCVAYGVSEPSNENLVRYGYGWGIFQKDSSMKDARVRLSKLIHTLQASSLLLENGGSDGFKIHDLVRNFVALFIFKDHPLLVLKDKDTMATQMQKERLESCTTICFPYIAMEELPKELDCPEMRIFLLFNNKEFIEVPDSYFNSMRKLAVLNLTGVHLTSSPTPFQSLENLCTLSLQSCSLENVAILGELKGLQILSFVNSKIERLPKEIGQLAKLRLLDLNNCLGLQIIEPGVLGRLIKLEELYMENSFNQWNSVEQTQPTNASLIELNHLKNLCTLHLFIPDPSVVPEDLDVKKLTKYKIRIGNAMRWSKDRGLRILYLELDPISYVLRKGWLQSILNRTDDLFLAKFNGSEQNIYALSQEGFPELKHLLVKDSLSIDHIFQWHSDSAFEMLESLLLEKLIILKKICYGHNSSKSFGALKVIQVRSCDNMEVLFPLSLLRGFPQLEEIEVAGCKLMHRIVEADDCGKVELHNLRVLKLCNLPNIKNFFTAGTTPSTSTLDDQVGTPIAFFNGQQISIPSLESLTMEELPNMEEIWSNESPPELSNLRSLQVMLCKSLLKVINFGSLVKLHKLHYLCIKDCNSVEEIFDLDGTNADGDFKTLPSELTTLKLYNLGSLRCIWNKNPCGRVSFLRLERLEAHNCPSLKFMFFPSMVKSLRQLRDLSVKHCKKMEAIIIEEEGLRLETSKTLVFPILTSLNLQYLESLMCFSCRKRSREARSQDRIKSSSNALFCQQVVLPSLETLNITGLDNIEMIWDNQVAANSFPKLKSLFVDKCNKVVTVVPSSILGQLLCLESLKANTCGSLEVVFELRPLNSIDGPQVAVPLKKLMVSRLPKLKCVWKKELTHQVNFQCLHSISVFECKSLTSLFPASIAKDLVQLEELEINGCGIMELIEKEEGLVPTFDFPKLTSLKLKHLTELKCIYTKTHVLHWPTLKTLQVYGCNKLEIFALQIENEMLLHKQPLFLIEKDSRYIQHLQTLDVSHCDGLLNMFTPTIAENLVALTKLRISNCRILTEVINDEKGGDVRVVAFNQLKYMELDGLIGLRSFSLGGYTLMFPLLEDIIVTRCPNMKFFSQGPMEASKLKRVQVSKEVWFWARNLNITIQNMFEEMGTFAGVEKMLLSEFPGLIGKWHNELNPIKSYWQLKSVVVDKCPSFINAIPSRLMLVLDNLSYLQVRDCELLEEIFDLEGLEVVESTRVLPQLRELNLVNLPKLRRLWNRDLQESLCFNSLKSLILYNCSNLGHAFSPSMAQCLANLEVMEIKECGQMEGVIVEEEGEGSATEKITFSKLQRMTMEYLPNLTCFLLGKNHILECPKLQKMIIAHCPKMESLIGQSQMEDDHSTPSFFTSQVQFPQLRWMDLSHMDDLSKIWTDGLQETLTFDCLRGVEVRNCKSLETLFPYWVATSLTELQKIQVESCEIDEIVASGDDTPCSNTTQDLFPKLTSLVLHDMPRLKSFCPNLPSLNWPLLEELQVTHCEKLSMLSFVASMNRWAQRDDQHDLSDQEAHSSFERDFPNLERLLLVNNNIQMIQDGNFSDDMFTKLKALTLACFHDKKAAFPSIFLLERFQNLQSLEVFCSSFEDLFPNEGLVEERKHPVLENLRELKLNKLHNLKCVWREDSLVSKILQSIETFEVCDCPCLTTIFPTETSFQNLTYLVVKNSSGLVHLVTTSAVANLVHLSSMTIIGCERMKEVVADDGNKEGKVISFAKLFRLTLEHLPNLECFSSIPSCIFRFPSLWNIEVEGCPKMKIFSKGTLSTPKLSYVSLFIYKWERNWEKGDDLNTTIQKLAA